MKPTQAPAGLRRSTPLLLALATTVGSAGLAARGTASALLGARIRGTEAAAGLPLRLLVVGRAATAVRSLALGYIMGVIGAIMVISAALASKRRSERHIMGLGQKQDQAVG